MLVRGARCHLCLCRGRGPFAAAREGLPGLAALGFLDRRRSSCRECLLVGDGAPAGLDEGESDNAFAAQRPSWSRSGRGASSGAPDQWVILALGAVGTAVQAQRDASGDGGAGGASWPRGSSWGYLAGAFPAAPTRTPAGAAYLRLLHGREPRRRDRGWARSWRGTPIRPSAKARRLGGRGARRHRVPDVRALDDLFASPQDGHPRDAAGRAEGPPPRLLWLVDRLRKTRQPGERLLYEESGVTVDSPPDPFRMLHYS